MNIGPHLHQVLVSIAFGFTLIALVVSAAWFGRRKDA